MRCLSCKSEKFRNEKTRFHPKVKDEQVNVVVDAKVCANCGKAMMDDAQMDMLRLEAADAYRTKYNLLTSKEIVAYRKKLGMSQREFAVYLEVGEASVKRWETYYVQEKSQDALIRLKCDETYAEESALTIHRKTHQSDEYTGLVQFDQNRVRNIFLYLAGVARSILFMNKALFYVDFLHFKKHGRGITGSLYFPIEYGPCPYKYDAIYEPMFKSGDLVKGQGHLLTAKKKADTSVFDVKEMETIQTVHDYLKKHGQQRLFDLSHKEAAYTETDERSLISYKWAKKLLIG